MNEKHCSNHGEFKLCIDNVKKKVEKLEEDHGEDIIHIHERIDTQSDKRIPNHVLFSILGAMCFVGLLLLHGNELAVKEANAKIEKNRLSIEKTIKEELKEQLKPIKEKLDIK